MAFENQSKLEILESFGYKIFPAGAGFAATVPEDPDAFYLEDPDYDTVVDEAYGFLLGEVDPNLHTLPEFELG